MRSRPRSYPPRKTISKAGRSGNLGNGLSHVLLILSPEFLKLPRCNARHLHQSHFTHQYYTTATHLRLPSITRLTRFSHKPKPPRCLQSTTRNGTTLTRIQTRGHRQTQCRVLKCPSPPCLLLQPHLQLPRSHPPTKPPPLQETPSKR